MDKGKGAERPHQGPLDGSLFLSSACHELSLLCDAPLPSHAALKPAGLWTETSANWEPNKCLPVLLWLLGIFSQHEDEEQSFIAELKQTKRIGKVEPLL